jgi:hypothetical protein
LTEHDKDIAKIAVVGDEKWRDEVYAFLAKGFRRAASANHGNAMAMPQKRVPG